MAWGSQTACSRSEAEVVRRTSTPPSGPYDVEKTYAAPPSSTMPLGSWMGVTSPDSPDGGGGAVCRESRAARSEAVSGNARRRGMRWRVIAQ